MKIIKGINIKYLIISLLLILALSLGSGCRLSSLPTAPPQSSPPASTATPINPNWTPPTTEGQATILPSIADVVALVKPSVVAINTEVVTYDIFNRPLTQEGAASGWIIDRNGIIVTNNHVIEGAKSVTVTLADGRTFPAQTVHADAYSDLAVVKIDAQNLTAASVGNSSQLRVGDWVVAIGNPLGLGISAKEGIISRLQVSLEVASGQTLYDLIETSAAINPGNSGGPLVNMSGKVIGITSAKIATVGVEGMGYAISINTAEPIIQSLINQGYVTRPWLGVGLQTVDQWIALTNQLAVDKGAIITNVASNSPAAKVGLQRGDVIVNLDGKEITNAPELIEAIHSSQIGQTVKITYWRGNTQNTTEATLIASPPS
jgi:serine protease Do